MPPTCDVAVKLASFSLDGRSAFGVVEGGFVSDLSCQPPWADLKDALPVLLRDQTWRGRHDAAPRHALDSVRLLPPIPRPDKTLCVGFNYAPHANEAGVEIPKYPSLFPRFWNAQVGHGEPIVRPRVSDQFDWEGELAVIIGRPGRHIPAASALRHVAGYACFAENSVRDWQKHSAQVTPGKNFTASGAFGPFLVTADEVPDPTRLTVRTRLNGKVVQEDTTANLVFPVPELIAYVSSFTELAAGDVIATGTPAGIGLRRKPPRFMKAGDVLEVEISGLGTLRNLVVDEAPANETPAEPAREGASP